MTLICTHVSFLQNCNCLSALIIFPCRVHFNHQLAFQGNLVRSFSIFFDPHGFLSPEKSITYSSSTFPFLGQPLPLMTNNNSTCAVDLQKGYFAEVLSTESPGEALLGSQAIHLFYHQATER